MQLQRQIDRLLARRASEWHQILETATEAQRAEFVSWLKQSPLHVKEYLETVYADRLLAHLDPERLEDVEALIAQIEPDVIALPAESAAPLPQRRRFSRWMAGAAACVLVSALLLGLAYQYIFAGETFTTIVGEQRTIQLPDTSIVALNVDSRISAHIVAAGRDIELLRGEALFNVAHDPQRPFRVLTRMAVIQAVGTQFNVYERPDGTRVSVLEGRVRVMPKDGNAADAVVIGAGEEVRVSLDGMIHKNLKADVAKTVVWRERRLIFADTPLEDVVYEFNRYSRAVRLRLEGVRPGSHHYNGTFDATDPESLAALLAREPDLSVERQNGALVIRPRTATSAP